MQSMLEKLGIGSGVGTIPLWLGLGFILLVILVSLGSWLVRSLRPSLNIGGQGRAGRPQRLAITDAFNLDREGRKLVIIRRDNVEHLLLIGGTNDVLVESNITRGERSIQNRTQRQFDESSLMQQDAVSVSSEFSQFSDVSARPTVNLAPETSPATTMTANATPRPNIAAVNMGVGQEQPIFQHSNTISNKTELPRNVNISAQAASFDVKPNTPSAAQPPNALPSGGAQQNSVAIGAEQRGQKNFVAPPNQNTVRTSPPPPPITQPVAAPVYPNAPIQQRAMQSPPPSAEKNFEDEFEKVLAGMGTGQEPRGKFSDNRTKRPEAPSSGQYPSQSPPSPQQRPPQQATVNALTQQDLPKSEPASEMARRLNEVLQRPLNAAKQQEPIGKPFAQQSPPLAAPSSTKSSRTQGASLPPPAESDMDLLEEEMARLLGRVSLPASKPSGKL